MTPAAERLRDHLREIYAPIDRSLPPPAQEFVPMPLPDPLPIEVLSAGVTIAEWGKNRPTKEVLQLLCAAGVFD
jgi:hypothetical protein